MHRIIKNIFNHSAIIHKRNHSEEGFLGVRYLPLLSFSWHILIVNFVIFLKEFSVLIYNLSLIKLLRAPMYMYV